MRARIEQSAKLFDMLHAQGGDLTPEEEETVGKMASTVFFDFTGVDPQAYFTNKYNNLLGEMENESSEIQERILRYFIIFKNLLWPEGKEVQLLAEAALKAEVPIQAAAKPQAMLEKMKIAMNAILNGDLEITNLACGVFDFHPSLLEAEMTMEHLKPIHEKKLDQLKKELADLDLPEANNVMKAFDVLYEAIVNKINIPSGELKSAAPDDEQSVIEDKQEIQNAIEELERYGQSLMEWHEHDKRDLLLITVKDFKPPLPIAVYASAREGRPVLMRQGNSYKVYDQIEDFQWDLKDLDESMTPLLAKLPFPNKAGEAKVLKGSDKSFSQKIVDKLQPLLFNYPINSDSYRKGRDIVVTCEKLKSRLLNPIFNIAALDKDFEKIISQNKTLDSFRRFSAKHIAANILFAPIGFILQIANLCRNGRLDIYFNSLSVPLLFNAKTTRREKSDHILGTVRKIQGKKGVAHKKEDVQEMKGDIEEEVKGESPGRKGPKKPD